MSNPYSIRDDAVAAIHAPVDARVTFLKKTYSLLLAALLVFAATLWAAGNIESVNSLARSLYMGPLVYTIVFIAGAMAVHWLAETRIGIAVFFAFSFVWALLSAPLILSIAGAESGPTIVNQAAVITAVTFTGLTLYVFKSGKDFAFLGGMLFTVMVGLLGLGLAGWLFGFSIGIWYSYAVALLFAGYMLYDTSNILHRFPTTAHVSAAMLLFTDVVIFFKQILIILASSRD